MADAINVTLTFERETKNTFRFRNEDEGSPIGLLYIRRDAFDSEDAPDTVKVSVKS